MARTRNTKGQAQTSNEPRINETAEEALQAWSKFIAICVRNQLEDIHSQHISDELMPDINRATRRGIYLALRNLFLMLHAKNPSTTSVRRCSCGTPRPSSQTTGRTRS